MLRDPARDRVVVVGGGSGTTPVTTTVIPLWSQPLAGGSWLLQLSTPGPVPRPNAAAVIDPVRDELVVFAGSFMKEPNTTKPDLWVQSPSTGGWTRIWPTGGQWPSKREGMASLHDPVRERMLVYGRRGA